MSRRDKTVVACSCSCCCSVESFVLHLKTISKLSAIVGSFWVASRIAGCSQFHSQCAETRWALPSPCERRQVEELSWYLKYLEDSKIILCPLQIHLPKQMSTKSLPVRWLCWQSALTFPMHLWSH